MAPIKKLKTYGRSNKSIVNNSVDAVNVLFAKNKAKTRQNKKKKILIKELPPRPRGQTLLADDSLHVSLEDTFDKIVKGNIYNVVTVKPQISLVNHSDSGTSKSFKAHYSPIMTRRRKKSASLKELSQTSQSNATNKSDSLIPRFKDSTVDKIDSSLEVEKIPNVILPTSLSYIKLPGLEVSNNLFKPDTSTNRKEISYDPIFTNTFREKQVIHSSTPMIPIKRKEKIINYTISPIKNLTLPEEPVKILKKRSVEVPLGTPIPRKSTARKAHMNVENNSVPQTDWKLQASLNVSSILPEVKDNTRDSRTSFITLRRRKVARSGKKTNIPKYFSKNLNMEVSNMSASVSATTSSDKNLTWNLEDFNSFVDKANGDKNLIRSLVEFDAFVAKMNNGENNNSGSKTSSSHRPHHLEQSVSFKTQNEDMLSSRQHVDNDNSEESKSQMETPINFVTKRRRRITDSCLESSKKLKTSKSKFTANGSKRRMSLQEPTYLEYSDFALKEAVVMLSKIKFEPKIQPQSNETAQIEAKQNELSDHHSDHHDNLALCTSYKNTDLILSEPDDSDIHEHLVLKELVINLIKLPSGSGEGSGLCSIDNETNNDESSIPDRSKSLFGNSYIENSVSVNTTQANQIDSYNISMSKCSDFSGNKEVTEMVTNKSIISKYNLREKKRRSFKTQRTVRKKSANRSLEQTSVHENMIEGAPRLSNRAEAIKTLKKNEGDVIAPKILSIQIHEFENFFVNMTKRTKSPKPKDTSAVNEVQSSEILEDSNVIDMILENPSGIIEEVNRELKDEGRYAPHLSNENIKVKKTSKGKSRGSSTKRFCTQTCEVENSSETVTKRSKTKSDSHETNSAVNEQLPLEKSEVLDVQHVNNNAERTSNPMALDKETVKEIILGSTELVNKIANLSNGVTAQETNGIKRNSSIKKPTVDTNFNKFENFYANAMKRSGGFLNKLDDNKSIVIEEHKLQKLDKNRSIDDVSRSLNPNAFDENLEKEKDLIVSLIKSPWRKKDTRASCPIQASLESTLVDLTSSDDEDCHKTEKFEKIPLKANTSKQPDSDSFRKSCSPDIIESSVLESDTRDIDGFRIPSITSFRRRQSKTLQLKAGKLWRRSLSEYKRSSLVLSVMNEEACIIEEGCYCNCLKCKLARQSRCSTSKRFSMKIVPALPSINPQRETTILESYAHNASYVSDQILEDNLENSIRSLSLSQRKNSIIQNSAPVTARELVLRRCGQTEPIPFGECYPGSLLKNCQKIGEGVYGEVFLFRNPNGGTSVMKVIPIEGDLIVNGERQKKFEEILSEIVIAMELSNLRNKKQNTTSGFSETQKIQCVQGSYPEKLRYLWDLYDETRGSENDSPEMFGEDQLYIVLQLANGGQDLEAFTFNNSLQAYTMFQQVACTLAVAEEELRFEHRDLHWGNILLSLVDKNKKVNFRLEGKNYEIMTKGVEVAIIDFTLSRIECDGVVIFNDLSLDPDLFTAEGDYQFEIYKLMQKKNGNNWERFEPYTNILWLHYTLDKAITALRYRNVQTKIHKEYISKLKHLKNDILRYNSVKEFVLNNF